MKGRLAPFGQLFIQDNAGRWQAGPPPPPPPPALSELALSAMAWQERSETVKTNAVICLHF